MTPAAQVEVFRRLDDGESFSEIARATGLTRNQIAGLSWRRRQKSGGAADVWSPADIVASPAARKLRKTRARRNNCAPTPVPAPLVRPDPAPAPPEKTEAPAVVAAVREPKPRAAPAPPPEIASAPALAMEASPPAVESVASPVSGDVGLSGAGAAFLALPANGCRWPIGDPKSEDFRFCGRPQARGAYCASCAERAYGPQRKIFGGSPRLFQRSIAE